MLILQVILLVAMLCELVLAAVGATFASALAPAEPAVMLVFVGTFVALIAVTALEGIVRTYFHRGTSDS